MALIRYPGSKDKLYPQLVKLFPFEVTTPLFSDLSKMRYCEPFFGSGAIGLKLLGEMSSSCDVWINDIDSDLVCLWRAVANNPDTLARLVKSFVPSVEAFYEFKAQYGTSDGADEERGLRKLALHRMSMSGFGVKSGGPIGGRSQSGAYSVECRWNAHRIIRDVYRIHNTFRRFRALTISCLDFAEVIRGADSNTFIYADPPYVVKGAQLYKHAMSEGDHVRLASVLAASQARWVVSYDDCDFIRELYYGCDVEELTVRYSNAVTSKSRPKNREVAFHRCG